MLNVLVTMRFDQAQLDRLRAVSPEVSVTQADQETADYAKTDVLYAGAPPRDLTHAPALKWVQLHMAGVRSTITRSTPRPRCRSPPRAECTRPPSPSTR